MQLQKNIFIITSKKIAVLRTLFFFDEIRYYIKFNKNDKFDYEKELGIFCDY